MPLNLTIFVYPPESRTPLTRSLSLVSRAHYAPRGLGWHWQPGTAACTAAALLVELCLPASMSRSSSQIRKAGKCRVTPESLPCRLSPPFRPPSPSSAVSAHSRQASQRQRPSEPSLASGSARQAESESVSAVSTVSVSQTQTQSPV